MVGCRIEGVDGDSARVVLIEDIHLGGSKDSIGVKRNMEVWVSDLLAQQVDELFFILVDLWICAGSSEYHFACISFFHFVDE